MPGMRPALHCGTGYQRSAHNHSFVDPHTLLLDIEVELVKHQGGEHQSTGANYGGKHCARISPVLVRNPKVCKGRHQVAGTCYKADSGIGIERQEGILQPRVLPETAV